jgi:hypothetical protein
MCNLKLSHRNVAHLCPWSMANCIMLSENQLYLALPKPNIFKFHPWRCLTSSSLSCITISSFEIIPWGVRCPHEQDQNTTLVASLQHGSAWHVMIRYPLPLRLGQSIAGSLELLLTFTIYFSLWLLAGLY